MTLLGTAADRRTATRKLAGNLDANDIDNTTIDEILERSDNWVCLQTNNFAWTDSDSEFETVLSASNLMASAEIREGIGGQDNATIAGNQRVTARDIIRALNRQDEPQGDGGDHDLYKTEQTEGD